MERHEVRRPMAAGPGRACPQPEQGAARFQSDQTWCCRLRCRRPKDLPDVPLNRGRDRQCPSKKARSSKLIVARPEHRPAVSQRRPAFPADRARARCGDAFAATMQDPDYFIGRGEEPETWTSKPVTRRRGRDASYREVLRVLPRRRVQLATSSMKEDEGIALDARFLRNFRPRETFGTAPGDGIRSQE